MAESTFTEAEILEIISDHKTAIQTVLKRQSYSLDTGMGKQSVTYASLGSIEKSLGEWEWRLQQLRASGNAFVSISGWTHRDW